MLCTIIINIRDCIRNGIVFEDWTLTAIMADIRTMFMNIFPVITSIDSGADARWSER